MIGFGFGRKYIKKFNILFLLFQKLIGISIAYGGVHSGQYA
jgi:hypothetical protein